MRGAEKESGRRRARARAVDLPDLGPRRMAPGRRGPLALEASRSCAGSGPTVDAGIACPEGLHLEARDEAVGPWRFTGRGPEPEPADPGGPVGRRPEEARPDLITTGLRRRPSDGSRAGGPAGCRRPRTIIPSGNRSLPITSRPSPGRARAGRSAPLIATSPVAWPSAGPEGDPPCRRARRAARPGAGAPRRPSSRSRHLPSGKQLLPFGWVCAFVYIAREPLEGRRDPIAAGGRGSEGLQEE
jgi:hypothetical protein